MDKRVKFDFEIYFTNGGSIKGEDFRLDIAGDTITDKELADYIVADLRLLMVGQTKILNKEILTEPHKRTPIDAEIEQDLLIDLSHTIEEGLVTYKGLPAPVICDYLSRENSKQFYEEGTEFQIGKIEMVSNTGTYIDCPFHRFEHGKDLSEIGLECFTDLDAVVISIPFSEKLEITEEQLKNYEIRNRAVLIHTGWDKNWNTERYYENHPYLTEGAAKYLRDCSVKLVGIDSHNIDNTQGRSRPVHTILLGAEILIVEHLCNLYLLPKSDFTFSAIPPKFKGVGTFPVRAMAKLRKI
ncbi:Kynurenine formamidase [Pedobacter steynii]|uniref:Kynurenine formamidase n=1 Tax=Pedobacter steynii TaxID=430522 RepID=A0A1G9UP11_9SPHI|nr:cyclase family protein [Pedobacter steynii]NQX40827.1 cyclase family protein [Pedobacter steynii]SDM61584.1 Kynurenine formamidase [Pedobacter steynii]